MQEVEGCVNLIERNLVSDQIVDVDLAFHVSVDNLRNVGATTSAAEGRALPDAARHELERAGRDFLTGFSHADNDGFIPSAMAAFECLAHDIDVAGRVDGRSVMQVMLPTGSGR